MTFSMCHTIQCLDTGSCTGQQPGQQFLTYLLPFCQRIHAHFLHLVFCIEEGELDVSRQLRHTHPHQDCSSAQMLRRNSTKHSSNIYCAAGSGTLSPTATALMSMLLRAIGTRPCTCQQQGFNHNQAG